VILSYQFNVDIVKEISKLIIIYILFTFRPTEIPSTHILPLVVLLPSLSPRYDDLPSNEAVIQVLSSLVKVDTESKAADRWQKWILDEVARCFPASGT